jgi:hypothetical protein
MVLQVDVLETVIVIDLGAVNGTTTLFELIYIHLVRHVKNVSVEVQQS